MVRLRVSAKGKPLAILTIMIINTYLEERINYITFK